MNYNKQQEKVPAPEQNQNLKNSAKDDDGASTQPDNNDEEAQFRAPEQPKPIYSLIHQKFNDFDDESDEMINLLQQIPEAMEFAHARDVFYAHLVGTFGILGAWRQPKVVRRCGLVHTAYSGDLFQFYIFKAHLESDREKVREIIGMDSERLVWLFGTCNRGQLCELSELISREKCETADLNSDQKIENRISGHEIISPKDAAGILLVTVADYLDQMVEINGWRDHHQIEQPESLYPGDGKPALAFYWMSQICKAIRNHLDVIPPVFDDCTATISFEDEQIARDSYWKVVIEENQLTVDEQIILLQKSVDCNRFIAEPHILLSQLFFRIKDYRSAAVHAVSALNKMYTLASAWDKRRSFEISAIKHFGFTNYFEFSKNFN